MFIKVKTMQDAEILINASLVTRIIHFVRDEGQEGCHLEFTNGAIQEVKVSLGELETLTEANSIEKIIEKLRIENMRIETHNQYQKLIDELIGGRKD